MNTNNKWQECQQVVVCVRIAKKEPTESTLSSRRYVLTRKKKQQSFMLAFIFYAKIMKIN